MNKSDIKIQGQNLLPWNGSKIDNLIEFLSHFPNSGRCPKNQKRNSEIIKCLKRQIETYAQFGCISDTIGNCLSYYDNISIVELVEAFIKDVPLIEKITFGNVTFINNSSMAETRFKRTASTVSKLLERFTDFHADALKEPLEIHFKYASQFKARAVYKSLLDEVWIKESAKVDNELYGHLLYIIVHELGHRYEKKNGLPVGFMDNMFYTTKYSMVDSMGGSETFAELFAVSFWEEQYPEYKDQIAKFKKLF